MNIDDEDRFEEQALDFCIEVSCARNVFQQVRPHDEILMKELDQRLTTILAIRLTGAGSASCSVVGLFQ